MRTAALRSLILSSSWLLIASTASAQEADRDFGWDCPALGCLPYRSELLVSTDRLARMLEDRDVVIVHVGSDEPPGRGARRVEYSESHIPRARFLRWSDLAARPDDFRLGSHLDVFRALGISAETKVVFYDTGIGREAAAAYAALDALGLADHAALLDGQWTKWALEGRPLSATPAPRDHPTRLDRRPSKARMEPDEWNAVLAGADRCDDPVTLIDARTTPPSVRGFPIRISWVECLESVNYPVMRSEKALRRLWSPVPARKERLLLIAGRNWEEAAPVYFAAKILGYSARILDGSMEEVEYREGGFGGAP